MAQAVLFRRSSISDTSLEAFRARKGRVPLELPGFSAPCLDCFAGSALPVVADMDDALRGHEICMEAEILDFF